MGRMGDDGGGGKMMEDGGRWGKGGCAWVRTIGHICAPPPVPAVAVAVTPFPESPGPPWTRMDHMDPPTPCSQTEPRGDHTHPSSTITIHHHPSHGPGARAVYHHPSPPPMGPCFAKPPSISPSLPFVPLMMVQG